MDANTHDIARDACMLTGGFARQGYDWWWHSFTAHHAVTGEERAFFVEFFLVNPALAHEGEQGAQGLPVLGQLPANKRAGVRPSYLMVKAGTWGKDARQLHRFFSWDEVEVGRGVPFYVAADDCICCETDLIGRVEVAPEQAAAHPEWMCDAGSMLWDLRLQKDIAFNVGYGASAPMRAAEAFQMYWHAEGMKTRFSGTVVLDGQTYVVDPSTSYGYADKNWGSDFTSPWVWLASSHLTSALTGKSLERSAFDIGGGRPKVGPVALDRKLLGAMVYEGRTYEFNFSKPWTGSRTSFACGEKGDEVVWHVEQDTFVARMVTDVTCRKEDMLLVNYEAPDGAKRYSRLWNGGNGVGRVQLYERRGGNLALVDDIRAANVGCEWGEYDVTKVSDTSVTPLSLELLG